MIKLPDEYCRDIQGYVDSLSNYCTKNGTDNTLISRVRDGDIVVCYDPKAARAMSHKLEVNGKSRVRVTYFGDNRDLKKTRGTVHFDPLALHGYVTRVLIDADRYLMDTKHRLQFTPEPEDR